MSKNILFLVAHPDDVEVCAGGTIAKHIANGDNVMVVISFMPSLPTKQVDFATRVNVRMVELEQAANRLGYDYTYFFESDRTHMGLRKWLASLEEKFPPENYDRVYTMHVGDSHQEHRAINEIAMSFCRDNTSDLIMCQPAIPGGVTHRPFVPNMYVDIGDFIEKKKEAIGIHKSQVEKYSPKRDWIEAVLARDRANGELIHCKYAEAFEIVKIVDR